MRTFRLALACGVFLALLGGLVSATTAQEDPIEPVSIAFSEGRLSLGRMLDYGRETLTQGLVHQMRGLEATNMVEHVDARLSGTLTWNDVSWDDYPGKMASAATTGRPRDHGHPDQPVDGYGRGRDRKGDLAGPLHVGSGDAPSRPAQTTHTITR